LRSWKEAAERNAVRDTAAGPDVIAALIADLAEVRDAILTFSAQSRFEEPQHEFAPPGSSEEERHRLWVEMGDQRSDTRPADLQPWGSRLALASPT